MDISEPFAHEKLSPVLAMYRAKTFDQAVANAEQLVEDGGIGHTASLYINQLVGDGFCVAVLIEEGVGDQESLLLPHPPRWGRRPTL